MTTSAKEVIAKNNLAVAAMEKGQQRETAALIRCTVSKLNELYAQQDDEDENDDMMDLDESNALRCEHCHKKRVLRASFPIASVPIDWERVCSQGAFPTMYQRALLLSTDEESVPVIAAVTLYNLALSQHLIGICYNRSKEIASAHRFYKLAYQIIEKGKHKVLFDDLLILAVVNNIADSCSQLYNATRSHMWFRCLAQIMGMNCASGSRSQMPAVDEDDYLFFYLNALLHQGNMQCSAAAA